MHKINKLSIDSVFLYQEILEKLEIVHKLFLTRQLNNLCFETQVNRKDVDFSVRKKSKKLIIDLQDDLNEKLKLNCEFLRQIIAVEIEFDIAVKEKLFGNHCRGKRNVQAINSF